MHVKMRDPNYPAGPTVVIEANGGETRFTRREAVTQAEVDLFHDERTELGHDVRTLIRWRDSSETVTEITLPATRGRPPVSILTNWDTWLSNQFGATIERIHRHVPVG